MKLQVLIADPNREVQKLMTAQLSSEGDMEAADVASDGLEALAKIKALCPDVVLLDLVQPRLDGLGVLRRLAAQENAPPVLVLTGFVNAHVIAECARLGAAYFLPKPCDTAELTAHLRQCAQTGNKPPAGYTGQSEPVRPGGDCMDHPLETVVTDVIHEIGVPAHIKGYRYLREGILFMIRDAGSVTGITKVLYPEIAKRFSTTSASVERAMRHAVEVAWDRGDEETRQKIFRSTVSGNRGKPTNGEFIAMIADYIVLRIRQGVL